MNYRRCGAGAACAGAILAVSILGRIASAQAIYVPNFTTSNVAGYLVNPSNAALQAVAGSPFQTGQSPVQAIVHPSGKFLYVLDAGSADITLYSIAAPSGSLTLIPCPRCDAASPSGMAIDPAGQLLFVVSSAAGTVTPYSIAPTGLLTKGPPAATGAGSQPVQAAVDPSGRYLYVANSGTGQVAGFSINGGALTPVAGSPFPAGSGPSSVAVSRTAVYVANLFSSDLSVYQIAPGGSLQPAGFSVPTGGGPPSVAVDPTGNYVYAANQNQVVAYNTTPNGALPLTVVQSVNAGTTPSYVMVSPDGNFVYVANTVSNDVYGFVISSGGTLVPAGSASTFGTSGQRFPSVQHIGDTTGISIDSGFPAPAHTSYGTRVELKGLIRNTRNPGIFPTGSVTVSVNGTPAPNGAVSLDTAGGFDLFFDRSTQYLPVGNSILTIAYNPGPNFEAPAPLSLTCTTGKATPVFTIGTSPGTPVAGQPMTILISAQQAGNQFPGGAVAISVDGVVAGASVALVNGTAQMAYTPATGSHTVTASFAGDNFFLSANTGPVTFHARRVTATALSSTSRALVYGQSSVFTASVSAAGGPVGGWIDFFDNQIQINPSPVLAIAGQAQFGPYAFNTLGTHVITAAYSGDADSLPSDSNAAPLVVTVGQASALVAQPGFSGAALYGQPATFTVTVGAAPPGSGNPSGSIVWKDGSATLGTTVLTAGSASLTTSTLSAGTRTITAVYSGDTNFLGGTSPGLPVSINRAPPSIAIAGSPSGTVVGGQPISLVATLTGSGAITGTVDFSAGTVSIGSAVLANKVATLAYTPAAAGARVITAAYAGDMNNLPVSGSLTLTVDQASVTMAAPVISGTSVVGQPLTLSATVAAAPPGAGIPSGTVAFQDRSSTIGTATLTSGTAAFTTTALAVGTHSITATYSGDASFAAGVSPPASVTIGRAAPLLSVSADFSTIVLGQPVVLTATLSGNTGSAFGGSVDWFDNGARISASPVPVTGDLARFGPYTIASAGNHAITASYSGDATYGSASNNANPLIVVVGQAQVAVSSPSLSTGAIYGSAASFSVSVATSGSSVGVPGGTVVLKEGGAVLASAALSNGAASLIAAHPLGAGSHLITAAYSGDANYLPATSSPTSISIAKATPSLAVVAPSPLNPVVGQVITLRAVIDGGPALTGTVDFFDAGVKVNSTPAPVNSGVAQTSAGLCGAGVHPLTAAYSGDNNFNAATTAATPVSVTVATARTTASVMLSAGLPTYGHPLTFLATVSPIAPAGGTPAGLVRLTDAGIVLGSATLTGGQGTVTIPMLMAGPHSIAVSYEGASDFASTTSPTLSMFVDREPTTTILSVLQSPGSSAFTARVTSSVPLVPAGMVQFLNNGGLVASATLDAGGVASTTAPAGTAGTITAVYSGNSNFYGSTSAASTITAIPRASTSLALRIGAVSVISGQSVTCTVTLTSSGTPQPSGSIQLSDGPVLVGSVSAAAQAVFTIAPAAGRHNLTASYTGDLVYAPSSATSELMVNKIGGALVLSGASLALSAETLTLAAALSWSGTGTAPEPGGRVDFLDGDSIVGSAALTNRKATLSLTSPAPGTHLFRSVYSGDANWESAVSNAISIAVTKTPTLVEIGVVPGRQDSEQTTVAARLATLPPGAGTPSGTIRFVDALSGRTLATTSLTGADAVASIPNTAEAPAIVALYDGDPKFQGASSAPVTQFSAANSASYALGPIVPDEIVTVFCPGLSDAETGAILPLPESLGGATVTLTDSQSIAWKAALFYVSPTQLSFLVPPGMTPGPASLRIMAASGAVMTAVVKVGRISPGLFTANASGRGPVAAQTVRVRPGEPPDAPVNIARYDPGTASWLAEPIDLGDSGDQTYLVLYATGIRHGNSDVFVEIGGHLLHALYAGAHPVYQGLDQVNVLLPPDLRNAGTVIASLSVSGSKSNEVELMFQSTSNP